MSLIFRGLLAVALAGLFAEPMLGQGLSVGMGWDIQLQAPLDLGKAVEIYDLDPDEVTAEQVAELKARGVMTICYVSVGTVEDWRADAEDFPQATVGRAYEGWPGERFLDIRDPAILALMTARFRRCAEMGFDAVDPDNIDLNFNENGFDLTARDVISYFAALSREAHRMGLLIGQKNAPDLTVQLAPLADFAVIEDCLADGWCAAMAAYPAAGKPVFAIEYQPQTQADCDAGRALGLSLVFKSLSLDRRGTACSGDF